jgi:PIN domain nuclease of toxin-antitoxin system
MGGHEVRYLLDTNAWLHAYADTAIIPQRESEIIADETAALGLSAISVWEVAKKHQMGKLSVPMGLKEWIAHALGINVSVLPLSTEVITDAMSLPDFPVRDPADELIVATARVHNLTLLTTDTKLKGYRHARVHYFKPILERGKRP